MSLEHFVDGLMSEYIGCGETPEYMSIQEPELRESEGMVYSLGQTLGIASKFGLGALGVYAFYTAGIAAGVAVGGALLASVGVKFLLMDQIFVKMGKKPVTLGGIVKRGIEEIRLYRKKRQVADLYNEHGPFSREEALEAAARVAELDTEEGLGELRIERYPE